MTDTTSMLIRLRRFVRPTASLLTAVILFAWITAIAAPHDGMVALEHASMAVEGVHTPITPPLCTDLNEIDERADCAKSCCPPLSEQSSIHREYLAEFRAWDGASAELFSATPTLAATPRTIPPPPVWPRLGDWQRPVDPPFSSYRVLLI